MSVGVPAVFSLGGDVTTDRWLEAVALGTPSLGRLPFTRPATSGARKVRMSPDGSMLAISFFNSSFGVVVWRTSDWSVLTSIISSGQTPDEIEFSPDSTRLAIGYQSAPYIRVWSFQAAAFVGSVTTVTARKIRWHPGGERLALVSQSAPYLVVVNTSSMTVETGVPAATNSTNGISWSASGLAVSDNTGVTVYDSATWAVLRTIALSSIKDIAWRPDGARLAIARDWQNLREYRVADWTFSETSGLSAQVVTIAYSADGQWVAIYVAYAPCVMFRTSDWLRVNFPATSAQYYGDIAISPVPLMGNVAGTAQASGVGVPGLSAALLRPNGDIASRVTTGSGGAFSLYDFGAVRRVLVIADQRAGSQRDWAESVQLAIAPAPDIVAELWPAGTPQTFGPGNVTTTAGLAADRVAVFLWADKRLVKTITPDAAGDWSADLAPGVYGLTYFAANCQPVTHGPYTVSEA